MTAPRLAIWTSGIPHPTEGASTVLFWHYIFGLRAQGFDVLNVLLLQPENSGAKALEEYRESAAAAGFEVAVCRSESFVVERHRNIRLRRDNLGPALESLARFQPDLSFCLDLVAAWAARETASPRVVWLGDLRFQTVWFHAFFAAREQPKKILQIPLALTRAFLWRGVYRRVLEDVSDVIVSSKSSEAALLRLGVRSGYEAYPWPSDERRAARPAATELAQPTFLFLGTLQALGSRSAFHYLFEKLYPKLIELWGPEGFQIMIAGRGDLPDWARGALQQRPEIVHVGFVVDLVELFGRVHAAIAPIAVPVGNRSRILTALAAETVVVAHENAALGNPDLVDGDTCYLARDPGDFVERMARCVDDPVEAGAVATRGRELYLSRFRPDVAVRAAADRLSAVLTSAANTTETTERS